MKTLCQSVVMLVRERCPSLVPKAEFLDKTFQKAFTYFADCRTLYDSGTSLSETLILQLGMTSPLCSRNLYFLLHSQNHRSTTFSSSTEIASLQQA